MHIEPGVVTGAKIALSYGTAAIAFAGAVKLAYDHVKQQGITSLLLKSVITTNAVFCFFEIFFHYAVGVSEVHLILGTSLLLLFGAAPTTIGLALGLLIQGLFFAPSDIPQYGMNVTTLLIPLYLLNFMVQRITLPGQAFKDFTYTQVLRFSLTYQGGIIGWVAFWAFYGHGLNGETLASVATFGLAYLSVVIIEPLVDLGLLALAKSASNIQEQPILKLFLEPKLFSVNKTS